MPRWSPERLEHDAAEQFIARGGGGKTVGAVSIVAFRPFALLGPCSATKWAVRGLTGAAAMEWAAEHGITVNACARRSGNPVLARTGHLHARGRR